MNRISRKLIALILTVLIAIGIPMNVFAAVSSKKYISDVSICYASSSNDAAEIFKAKKFELGSTEPICSEYDKNAYIGFKYSYNKEDAITDFAFMNMNGKYSYSDYEKILADKNSEVDNWAIEMFDTIKEFRKNYNGGVKTAIRVYEYLNKIYEDYSGLGLGDFFLQCSVTEDDHEDLVNVFLKGNSALLIGVQQALLLACDVSSTTWVERLSKITYDDIEERYLKAFKTINNAESEMSIAYDDTANLILDDWDNLYSVLSSEEEYPDVSDQIEIVDNEDAVKYEEDVVNSVSNLSVCINSAVIELLKNTEYEDGTLFDFFNRPYDDVDIWELYPMCDVLSKGQKAELSTCGLFNLLKIAVDSNKSVENTDNFDLDEMFDSIDDISIYDGVDLEVFEKGVALTSDAAKYSSSSKDKWYDCAYFHSEDNNQRWIAYSIYYLVPTFICAAFWIGSLLTIANILNKARKAVKVCAIEMIYNEQLYYKSFDNFFVKLFYWFIGLFGINTKISLGLNLLKIVSLFGLVVFLVIDVVMLVMTWINSSTDVHYDDIPHHILDATSQRNSIDYTMYKAAKTTDERAADMYNYSSEEGWLVLYYTKDAKAGNPITGIQIKRGTSEAPSGYKNAHLFGSKNAVNISSDEFTDAGDKSNGTYLYFKDVAPSNLTGSIFTNGTVVIAIALGLVFGVLSGILIGKKTGKKSKEVIV